MVSDNSPRDGDDISLLPTMRALMTCHSAVDRVSSRHIEATGLTPSQFDVLATLGETTGLTCTELGRRTLITKGTLSPVLDRMVVKGLVTRRKGENDARQSIVSLTPLGEKLFDETFYAHVETMKQYLSVMPEARQVQLIALLDELRSAFE